MSQNKMRNEIRLPLMTISTRIGTSLYNYIYSTSVTKQGVALTGQNYAGPP